MKRTIFLCAGILFSTTILFSQMNTGSKFISGNSNFGINSYSEKDKGSDTDADKFFNLNLTTRGGYFLKNRLAIGGLVDLGFNKSEYPLMDEKSTSSHWMVGPLVRYYTEYGNIIPFAEASIGFGMEKSTYEYFESNPFETKHSLFGLKGGVGADYFINESIAVEGMASYYYNRLKPKMDGATGEGHVKSGFEVTFGVVFYFGTIKL